VSRKSSARKNIFICEAGRFDTLNQSAGLGYLMLSSYEESWSVLNATRQMFADRRFAGDGLSSAILWILIRKITEPLRQLRDARSRRTRRLFQRVIATSRDECGELAIAFIR